MSTPTKSFPWDWKFTGLYRDQGRVSVLCEFAMPWRVIGSMSGIQIAGTLIRDIRSRRVVKFYIRNNIHEPETWQRWWWFLWAPPRFHSGQWKDMKDRRRAIVHRPFYFRLIGDGSLKNPITSLKRITSRGLCIGHFTLPCPPDSIRNIFYQIALEVNSREKETPMVIQMESFRKVKIISRRRGRLSTILLISEERIRLVSFPCPLWHLVQ
jgi:hypothetical protein